MSKELPQEIMSYAIDIAGNFGLKLLTALIVIIVGRQLVKILLKVIKVALEKSKTEETVRIFIANLLNTIRIDIIASCSYEDDLKKVKEVLKTVLDNEKRILPEPKPQIAVSELADSSVNFIVRPWVNSSEYLPVKYSLLEEIKNTFDREGISIPYPQTDIHIHEKKA